MKPKATVRQATGPRRSEFPKHLQTTPDEWRATKRQEWREVHQALQRFHYGAAYVPCQAQLWKLSRLVEQVTEELERTDWKAW